MRQHPKKSTQVSDGYLKAVQAIGDAIAQWMSDHKGASPELAVPPPAFQLITTLKELVDRVGLNEDGRSLLRFVLEEYRGPGDLTFQQLACVILVFRFEPPLTVCQRPIEHFIKGFSMHTIQRGGSA